MGFYGALIAVMTAVLPTPIWSSPPPAPAPVVTPRPVINASASSQADTQLTVAAANAPLRVLYGQVRVGAQIAYVLPYQGCLVVCAIWSYGGNDGLVTLNIDDKAPVAGVQANHYTGMSGQGIDPILAAAFAAQTPPVVYTDTLPNICYSALKLPPGATTGGLNIAAVWRGRKVYDPRSGLTVYSNNPALCEADFIINADFGMGEAVDWTSVSSVATDNDELLGTAPNQVKRRTLNLVLETVQESDLWRQTLNTYAGCWSFRRDGGWVLVSDKAASPVATISHDAGQIQSIGPLEKRGAARQPTVMIVTYTDTTVIPYGKGTAVEYASAAHDESVPSQIDLPGIDNYAQAKREAFERLKKLLLNDLSFPLGVFDDGLALELGDVIEVTYPLGLSAKQVRILGHAGEYGRYQLSCTEYDPAAYSNSVEFAPTYPDTDLPSPLNPPAITGLVVTEVLGRMQTGRLGSRFSVSWDALTFPFIDGYRVEVWASGQLVDSTTVNGAVYASPFVQEGIYYTVKVASMTVMAIGSWTQDSKLAQGKLLPPGDVPFFNCFELGGVVYYFWTPAVDLDLTGYEIRRATINGAETVAQHWARGTVVMRVADPGVTADSQTEPVGTWRYMIKALDSVRSATYPFGQESVNAIYKDVTVTSDAKAFWSASYQFAAHTLTNMIEYSAYPPIKDQYISSGGTALSTALPLTPNDYPNPIATYDAPVSSEFLTEAHDVGAIVAGQWIVDVDTSNGSLVNLTGTADVTIELSDTGAVWTSYTGTSAKGSGRFVRVRVTTAGVMMITGHPTIRVSAVPKTEEHTITTSASGPVTLTLDNHYIASVGEPVPRVTSSTLTHAQCNNVQVSPTAPNTVDVYAWDNAGNLVVANVGVTFNGILA
jgi:hypothetical protein